MAPEHGDLRKFVAPEIVYGAGSRRLAGRYAAGIGASHVLLVTDPGVDEAGWVSPVHSDLGAMGLRVTRFDGVTSNPRETEVARGAEMYGEHGCDTIVVVGGGSPMDCAKGIGVVVSNGKPVLEFEGVDRVGSPMPPLICVPTTGGTGAEASQFAIILDESRHTKAALISKALVPDIALVDPEPLTTMDPSLTISTGLDALVHAIEALSSNAHWLMTDQHALAATSLISHALPDSLEHPGDPAIRAGMALASLHAGLAFSNASLGAVHAIAHALGGSLDLAHGDCIAVVLASVLRANLPHMTPGRVDVLASAFGLESGEDADERILDWLSRFMQSFGATKTLGDIGVSPEDVPTLARKAHADACLATNPWLPTVSDLEVILHDAL